MSETTKADTPYFSANRDESDLAYELGFQRGCSGDEPNCPYQKQTQRMAYYSGYRAGAGITGKEPAPGEEAGPIDRR